MSDLARSEGKPSVPEYRSGFFVHESIFTILS